MSNPNVDHYATITGFGDSIELWATAHGMTLDDALDAGVCSPDDGDEVYVPHALIRELDHEQELRGLRSLKGRL